MSSDDKTGPAPVVAVRQLGEYIREQRRSSQISLRQLATLAGVSNPYLSQIERGLRKPSAEILQQIAKGLRISAEALYVQAGILDQRESSGVVDALLADEALNERQKQVLLEIYDSFRKENAALTLSEQAAATLAEAEPGTARPAASPLEAGAVLPVAVTTPAPDPDPAAPSPPSSAPSNPTSSPPSSPKARRPKAGTRRASTPAAAPADPA